MADTQRSVVVLYGGIGRPEETWIYAGALPWSSVSLGDPENDGFPPEATHAAADHAGRDEVLLYDWTDGVARSWLFDHAENARPDAVFQASLRAAALEPGTALNAVAFSWSAGGVGFPVAGGCAQQEGVDPRIWDAGRWRKVTESATAAPGAVETIAWSTDDTPNPWVTAPLIPDLLPAGTQEYIRVAVLPRAASGCGATPGEVEIDYVEVVVDYTRP